MVVCKFFQQGRCRYGDACHNEHPGARNSYEQPQMNRFAALSNQGGGGGGFGSRTRANATVEENPYYLVAEDIRLDLTLRRDHENGERPLYPLGAYGPGKGAPKQLIEGELEQSPEELRVQAYLALANGALPQFEAGYTQLVNLMESKIKNIIENTEDARRFAADTSHPNRNDSVNKPASMTWPYRLGQSPATSSGGFGTTQAASGFGGPSRPGFGGASQPAFGAPSLSNSGNAFGSASSGATGGFGAPSALGSKPSPFGAAPSAAPSTGFGAPSALGSKPSPFGGGQQAASGFGAPSTIGAKPSPFGAPQQPATGGFGAPSQPAFGSSGFGTKPAASPFAAAAAQPNNSSPFAAATQPIGGFGSQQPAAQTNSSPFGGSQQQPQTAGPAFGTPSAFGAARPSPFATAAQQQQPQPGGNRPNPFAASTSQSPAAQTNSSPFGGGQQQQTQTAAPAFGTSSLGANTQQAGIPSHWKGKRVIKIKEDKNETVYGYMVDDASKPGGQGLERIWFIEGPPEVKEKLNAMTEAPAIVYEDPALGPKLKEIYEWTEQHGTFVKDGVIIMPEVPPKREWCSYDF